MIDVRIIKFSKEENVRRLAKFVGIDYSETKAMQYLIIDLKRKNVIC